MTKEETENYIYDKLIELRIERHLSTEPKYSNFYDDAKEWFRTNENSSYGVFEKEDSTGYVSIHFDDIYGHEIYLYVNDIDDNAIKQMRQDKLNELLE